MTLLRGASAAWKTLGCILAGLGFGALHAQTTTYHLSGPAYATVTNFTSCPVGNCANYATSMTPNGWISTVNPVAANLFNQDIRAQVSSFSFSDGLTTFSSADPLVERPRILQVSTDAAGTITTFTIWIARWQDAGPTVGGRIDLITGGSTQIRANHNGDCSAVDPAGSCSGLGVSPQRGGSIAARSGAYRLVAVAKTDQTINFGAQAGQTYGVAPFALNPLATASSGLPVSYSSLTPAVCTVGGSTVTIVTAGTCTIAADQAGDATYNPAPQVTQNIAIAGLAGVNGVKSVPTLSEWALILLAGLVSAIGIPLARRVT